MQSPPAPALALSRTHTAFRFLLQTLCMLALLASSGALFREVHALTPTCDDLHCSNYWSGVTINCGTTHQNRTFYITGSCWMTISGTEFQQISIQGNSIVNLVITGSSRISNTGGGPAITVGGTFQGQKQGGSGFDYGLLYVTGSSIISSIGSAHAIAIAGGLKTAYIHFNGASLYSNGDNINIGGAVESEEENGSGSDKAKSTSQITFTGSNVQAYSGSNVIVSGNVDRAIIKTTTTGLTASRSNLRFGGYVKNTEISTGSSWTAQNGKNVHVVGDFNDNKLRLSSGTITSPSHNFFFAGSKQDSIEVTITSAVITGAGHNFYFGGTMDKGTIIVQSSSAIRAPSGHNFAFLAATGTDITITGSSTLRASSANVIYNDQVDKGDNVKITINGGAFLTSSSPNIDLRTASAVTSKLEVTVDSATLSGTNNFRFQNAWQTVIAVTSATLTSSGANFHYVASPSSDTSLKFGPNGPGCSVQSTSSHNFHFQAATGSVTISSAGCDFRALTLDNFYAQAAFSNSGLRFLGTGTVTSPSKNFNFGLSALAVKLYMSQTVTATNQNVWFQDSSDADVRVQGGSLRSTNQQNVYFNAGTQPGSTPAQVFFTGGTTTSPVCNVYSPSSGGRLTVSASGPSTVVTNSGSSATANGNICVSSAPTLSFTAAGGCLVQSSGPNIVYLAGSPTSAANTCVVVADAGTRLLSGASNVYLAGLGKGIRFNIGASTTVSAATSNFQATSTASVMCASFSDLSTFTSAGAVTAGQHNFQFLNPAAVTVAVAGGTLSSTLTGNHNVYFAAATSIAGCQVSMITVSGGTISAPQTNFRAAASNGITVSVNGASVITNGGTVTASEGNVVVTSVFSGATRISVLGTARLETAATNILFPAAMQDTVVRFDGRVTVRSSSLTADNVRCAAVVTAIQITVTNMAKLFVTAVGATGSNLNFLSPATSVGTISVGGASTLLTTTGGANVRFALATAMVLDLSAAAMTSTLNHNIHFVAATSSGAHSRITMTSGMVLRASIANIQAAAATGITISSSGTAQNTVLSTTGANPAVHANIFIVPSQMCALLLQGTLLQSGGSNVIVNGVMGTDGSVFSFSGVHLTAGTGNNLHFPHTVNDGWAITAGGSSIFSAVGTTTLPYGRNMYFAGTVAVPTASRLNNIFFASATTLTSQNQNIFFNTDAKPTIDGIAVTMQSTLLENIRFAASTGSAGTGTTITLRAVSKLTATVGNVYAPFATNTGGVTLTLASSSMTNTGATFANVYIDAGPSSSVLVVCQSNAQLSSAGYNIALPDVLAASTRIDLTFGTVVTTSHASFANIHVTGSGTNLLIYVTNSATMQGYRNVLLASAVSGATLAANGIFVSKSALLEATEENLRFVGNTFMPVDVRTSSVLRTTATTGVPRNVYFQASTTNGQSSFIYNSGTFQSLASNVFAAAGVVGSSLAITVEGGRFTITGAGALGVANMNLYQGSGTTITVKAYPAPYASAIITAVAGHNIFFTAAQPSSSITIMEEAFLGASNGRNIAYNLAMNSATISLLGTHNSLSTVTLTGSAGNFGALAGVTTATLYARDVRISSPQTNFLWSGAVAGLTSNMHRTIAENTLAGQNVQFASTLGTSTMTFQSCVFSAVTNNFGFGGALSSSTVLYNNGTLLAARYAFSTGGTFFSTTFQVLSQAYLNPGNNEAALFFITGASSFTASTITVQAHLFATGTLSNTIAGLLIASSTIQSSSVLSVYVHMRSLPGSSATTTWAVMKLSTASVTGTSAAAKNIIIAGGYIVDVNSPSNAIYQTSGLCPLRNVEFASSCSVIYSTNIAAYGFTSNNDNVNINVNQFSVAFTGSIAILTMAGTIVTTDITITNSFLHGAHLVSITAPTNLVALRHGCNVRNPHYNPIVNVDFPPNVLSKLVPAACTRPGKTGIYHEIPQEWAKWAYRPNLVTGNANTAGSIGLDFDLTKPIFLYALGCFNNNAALAATIQLGIYDRLTGVLVPGTFYALTAANTEVLPGVGLSQFSLPLAVLLPVGQYSIVAFGYSLPALPYFTRNTPENGAVSPFGFNVCPNTLLTTSPITFIGTRINGPALFAYPTTLSSHTGEHAAGTFLYAEASCHINSSIVQCPRYSPSRSSSPTEELTASESSTEEPTSSKTPSDEVTDSETSSRELSDSETASKELTSSESTSREPSMSESTSVSASKSVTNLASLSASESQQQSGTKSGNVTGYSFTLSSSFSTSKWRSNTESPSPAPASQSHSASASATQTSLRSLSASSSNMPSASRSVTNLVSVSVSASASTSESIVATLSVSSSVMPSVSTSDTRSVTASDEHSESASRSVSDSMEPTQSESTTEEPSMSATASASTTVSLDESLSASTSGSTTASSEQTRSVTPSDELSASDTSSQSVSEEVSGSDSASVSATESASVSESASISIEPSASDSASLTTMISNSASPTDELSQSESISTSISDTVTPSKGSHTPTHTLSLSDELTGSESATVSLSQSLSVSSSESGTVSTTLSLSLSPTDELTSSESRSLTLSASVSFSETVSHSMSLSDAPTSSVSASDLKTSSDSVSVTVSVSLSVSVTVTKGSQTPSLSFSDEETASATPSGSPTDELSQSASASTSLTDEQSASVSQSTSLSASATRSATIGSPTRTLSLSKTTSHTESASLSVTVQRSDSVSTSGTPSWTLSLTASESRTNVVSDSATGTLTLSPTASESFEYSASVSESFSSSTTESLTDAVSDSVTVSSSNTTSESVSATPSTEATASDSASFSHDPTGSPTRSAEATGTKSRTLTPGPSISRQPSPTRSLSLSRTRTADPLTASVTVTGSASAVLSASFSGSVSASSELSKTVQSLSFTRSTTMTKGSVSSTDTKTSVSRSATVSEKVTPTVSAPSPTASKSTTVSELASTTTSRSTSASLTPTPSPSQEASDTASSSVSLSMSLSSVASATNTQSAATLPRSATETNTFTYSFSESITMQHRSQTVSISVTRSIGSPTGSATASRDERSLSATASITAPTKTVTISDVLSLTPTVSFGTVSPNPRTGSMSFTVSVTPSRTHLSTSRSPSFTFVILKSYTRSKSRSSDVATASVTHDASRTAASPTGSSTVSQADLTKSQSESGLARSKTESHTVTFQTYTVLATYSPTETHHLTVSASDSQFTFTQHVTRTKTLSGQTVTQTFELTPSEIMRRTRTLPRTQSRPRLVSDTFTPATPSPSVSASPSPTKSRSDSLSATPGASASRSETPSPTRTVSRSVTGARSSTLSRTQSSTLMLSKASFSPAPTHSWKSQTVTYSYGEKTSSLTDGAGSRSFSDTASITGGVWSKSLTETATNTTVRSHSLSMTRHGATATDGFTESLALPRSQSRSPSATVVPTMATASPSGTHTRTDRTATKQPTPTWTVSQGLASRSATETATRTGAPPTASTTQTLRVTPSHDEDAERARKKLSATRTGGAAGRTRTLTVVLHLRPTAIHDDGGAATKSRDAGATVSRSALFHHLSTVSHASQTAAVLVGGPSLLVTASGALLTQANRPTVTVSQRLLRNDSSVDDDANATRVLPHTATQTTTLALSSSDRHPTDALGGGGRRTHLRQTLTLSTTLLRGAAGRSTSSATARLSATVLAEPTVTVTRTIAFNEPGWNGGSDDFPGGNFENGITDQGFESNAALRALPGMAVLSTSLAQFGCEALLLYIPLLLLAFFALVLVLTWCGTSLRRTFAAAAAALPRDDDAVATKTKKKKSKKGRIIEKNHRAREPKGDRWKAYETHTEGDTHGGRGGATSHDAYGLDAEDGSPRGIADDLQSLQSNATSVARSSPAVPSCAFITEPLDTSGVLLFLRNHLYFSVLLPGTLRCWWRHAAMLTLHVELVIVLFVLLVKAANPASSLLVVLLGIASAAIVTVLTRPSIYKRFHFHEAWDTAVDGERSSGAHDPHQPSSQHHDPHGAKASASPLRKQQPATFLDDVDVDAVFDWQQEQQQQRRATDDRHNCRPGKATTASVASGGSEAGGAHVDKNFFFRRNNAFLAFGSSKHTSDADDDPSQQLHHHQQQQPKQLDDYQDDIPSIGTASVHHVEDRDMEEEHWQQKIRPADGIDGSLGAGAGAFGRLPTAFPALKMQASLATFGRDADADAGDDDGIAEDQPRAAVVSRGDMRTVSKFFVFAADEEEEADESNNQQNFAALHLHRPRFGAAPTTDAPFASLMAKEAPPVISESADGDEEAVTTLFSPSAAGAGGDDEFGNPRPVSSHHSWSPYGSPRSVGSFRLNDVPAFASPSPTLGGPEGGLLRGRASSVWQNDVVVEDVECLTIWSPRGQSAGGLRPRTFDMQSAAAAGSSRRGHRIGGGAEDEQEQALAGFLASGGVHDAVLWRGASQAAAAGPTIRNLRGAINAEFTARCIHDADLQPSESSSSSASSSSSSSSSTPRTLTDDDRIVVKVLPSSPPPKKQQQPADPANLFDFEVDIDVDGIQAVEWAGGSPQPRRMGYPASPDLSASLPPSNTVKAPLSSRAIRSPPPEVKNTTTTNSNIASPRHAQRVDADVLSQASSHGSLSSGERVAQARAAAPRHFTKHWVFAVAMLLFAAILVVGALFPREACACTAAPNVPLLVVLLVDGGVVQMVAAALRRRLL